MSYNSKEPGNVVLSDQSLIGSNFVCKPQNPWLSIWLSPCNTVRYLIRMKRENDALKLWFLFTVFVAGIPLVWFFYGGFRDRYSERELFLAIIIFELFYWSYYYVGGYLFWYLGRWAGGCSEKWQIKVAIAWTTVIPGTVFSLLTNGLELFFGKKSIIFVLQYVGCIWYFLIAVYGIREVLNLSSWRAAMVVLGGVLGWTIFAAGLMLITVITWVFIH